MKKMEQKIALTFVIMFVVSLIINGIHSIITMESNFITFEVMTTALIDAIAYLVYIWIISRRHRLLAFIGALAICLVVLFAYFSSVGSSDLFSGWDWKGTVMCIYYMIAAIISVYQGEKLLEEDKEPIKITITFKGDIDENVEVISD